MSTHVHDNPVNCVKLPVGFYGKTTNDASLSSGNVNRINTRHMHRQIRIIDPCGESWEKMTKTTGCTRFCASCQKEVVDFTGSTDRQIVRYLDEHVGEKICGRFMSGQLNRPLKAPKETSTELPSWQRWVLATIVMIGLRDGYTQETKTAPSPKISVSRSGMEKQTNVPVSTCVFTGYVRDIETGEEVIGAKVYHRELQVGGVTDIDGVYLFTMDRNQLADTLVLQVEAIGYETQVLTYSVADNFPDTVNRFERDIRLNPEMVQLIDGMIIGEVTRTPNWKSRRSIRKSERRQRKENR